MGSDVVARFRLSVWRPAQLGRPLDYSLADDDAAKINVAFDIGRLQEEVYHWNPGQEDVWGCIGDSELSRELRDIFVEGFAPSHPPEQRSMIKFRQAVERLGAALTTDGVSSWADMQQTVCAGHDDSTNLRADSALSLWHHMEWILRTFGSLPGATVTIR